MIEPTIEGTGNIPASPTLVIPNRVDLATLRALEEALGGRDRVAWMVENSLRPDPEVMMYLSQSRAAGFLCAIDRSNPEDLVNMVRDRLVQGRFVVLLCGRPGQQAAALTDVPGKLLSFADNSKLSALPVYIGMFNQSLTGGITTRAPYDRVNLQFMPELKPGAALGSRVRSAWMEAAAEQLNHHPALQQSLPQALIRSIIDHQEALIIDGVDDSQLSYRRLLIYALIMAEKLHKRVTNRRLGIILPPGKLAAVANLACLLAGITPVNINYTAAAEDFRYQTELSGINRFITEVRFTHKLQQFSWPAPRDLIYIDRELADISAGSVKLRELAIRFGKVDLLTRHLMNHQQPNDEAVLLFSTATGGIAKGCPYTHRMLLSAVLQLSSRLPLSAGQRALGAMPLYLPAGLLCGLLLPLLHGMDIVTYPDTRTPRRLCELAHNYSTALTVFTPAQTHAILQVGKPAHFAGMRYFLTAGEKLSGDLLNRAARDYKLTLYECYSLAECALPVAINAPTPATAPGTAHIIPAGQVGSVGAPMPGIAVRISDLNRPEQSLPPSTPGLIWLKGSAVISSYLKDKPDAATCMRGKWFCTGDVGKLDHEGLLTISGRKSRFSKINDDLVPHEAAEEALCRVLGVDPSDGVRRLAIVGVPNPKSGNGEILVLLSTLHKTVVPQDLITARYGLLNARYPASWAPNRILPVTSIPVLANGKLDYPLCYRGVCQQLGISLH